MNLIRQRDDLKAALAVKALTPALVEEALRSPVFQWWSDTQKEGDSLEHAKKMTPEEREFILENILEEVSVEPLKEDGKYPNQGRKTLWPRFTPYNCFRISYMDKPIYEQWWVSKEAFTVFHCDDGWSHSRVKNWTVHQKWRNNLGSWLFRIWADEKRMDCSDGLGKDDGDMDSEVEFRAGAVSMYASERDLSRYASQITRMLGVFMFDIYGAGHTVVKVSPKHDPTKSVQWRQAREHYLVLRRERVEKLRETRGHVTDDDLIRAAHWRRAHLRRLSSGKYVNKRGLLVPVRKAWVGPTEWEGKDSKVYTVVGMEPPSLTSVS